jgi:hypothetical protein
MIEVNGILMEYYQIWQPKWFAPAASKTMKELDLVTNCPNPDSSYPPILRQTNDLDRFRLNVREGE